MAIKNSMKVMEVIPGSIGEQMGVQPGDGIMAINNRPVRDIIDYRFLTCEAELTVSLVKGNSEEWILDIEKDFDDDLGLVFKNDGLGRIKRCRNKCVFCFLAQLPEGMRKTLYFNDDDYRLSFFHGNFVTLTNVSRQDLKRIVDRRLSPLYISVHTTNPLLREKMLNNKQAGNIMKQLAFLAAGDIQMHAQAVLCPGINDGPELKRTIGDLYSLWPATHSLALVPVGLTRYRKELFPLDAYNKKEAQKVLETVKIWQDRCLRQSGYPFVFAGDEFYLLAGAQPPGNKYYADFPQTENGVGLARIFLNEWAKVSENLPQKLNYSRKMTIATGISGEQALGPVVERLNRIRNLNIRLCGIVNRFFGEKITVAGLLTAQDLYEGLKGSDLGDCLVIPSVMLRSDDQIFLDNLQVSQLAGRLGVPVAVAKGPQELVEIILSGEQELSCQNQF